MFTERNGDRKNSPNFLVFLTDGNSNINAEETLPMATETRLMGVTIIVASVGNWLNMFELRGLASLPVDKHFFTVERFSQIPTLVRQIEQAVCNG